MRAPAKIVTGNGLTQNGQSTSEQGQKIGPTCIYCKKVGHNWQEYRKRINRKPKIKDDKDSEKKTDLKKQNDNDEKEQPKNKQDASNSNRINLVMMCVEDASIEDDNLQTLLYAKSVDDNLKTSWIVDSGASSHAS